MKVTNLNSNYDAAVQSQQIDDAIAQKFDLIVMVYVNDQAMVPALTRAKAAGIPVVLVVTPLKKDYEELFTSYVGTDHVELGRLAGEDMVKGLKADGQDQGADRRGDRRGPAAQRAGPHGRLQGRAGQASRLSSWSPRRTASGTPP